MSRRDLKAVLRTDLASFIHRTFRELVPGESYLPNWHIDAIAEHLMQCARGDIKRLVITIPPRSLKSIAASVAFSAWVLGRQPHRKLICASYSQELSGQLSVNCRSIMGAEWYGDLFPGVLLPGKHKQNLIRTSEGGMRLATSVSGTMRGFGGDMIILDDPLKGIEMISKAERTRVAEWYDSVVVGRLNNKNEGVIILIMQRIHEDDLVGHVMEREEWVELKIPAIAPERQSYLVGRGLYYPREAGEVIQAERESREHLDQVLRSIGSYNFAAQYQQEPVPLAGNLFRRAWFQRYQPDVTREFDQVVQSWDTGITGDESSDYSVCTTWGIIGQDCYLIDVFRRQLEYPDLKRHVIALAERHRPTTILIEAAGTGRPLVQELRRETELRPIAVKVKGDKEVRAISSQAKVEGGHVLLLDGAPWLSIYLDEMAAFPGGRHDDQVDSTTQFLRWMIARSQPAPRRRPDPQRPLGVSPRPKGQPMGRRKP
jgi:predicted phage terminase large subunit-like protein